MKIHIGCMIASIFAALVGALARDKDLKLVFWPLAYALMSMAMILR